MEHTKIEEAFEFKKFIEELEKAITDFLNIRKKGHRIVSKIHIYNNRIAVFLIGYNVGFGGQSLTYEAVMLKSEIDGPSTDFSGEIQMPNPETVGSVTRYMSSTQPCSAIIKKDLPTPLGQYYEDRILDYMRELVESFFKNNDGSTNEWEVITATPHTSYKLSA